MGKGATISMNTLVARHNDVFFAEIDAEVVMMSPDHGSYCGINEIGGRVWQLIETPVAVSDLCDALMEEFEVEREVCEREVIAFLDELVREGLARTVDEASA